MSHRRDRKDTLRQQREAREAQRKAQEQRKKLVGYGIGAAIALAALVLVVLALAGGDSSTSEAAGELFPEGGDVPAERLTDVNEAARAADCELTSRRSTNDRAGIHTSGPDVNVDYPDNPPTLGRHWPPGFQAQDGLYGEAPADEALVHTMEHGRVIIWAKPSLPRDVRATLRALFEEDDYQMVLVPRRNMPYAVAATAWNGEPGPSGTGRTLGCDRWNEQVVDAIRTFRDEHRSQGPEFVP